MSGESGTIEASPSPSPSLVILSEVNAEQGEASTQSKDPEFQSRTTTVWKAFSRELLSRANFVNRDRDRIRLEGDQSHVNPQKNPIL